MHRSHRAGIGLLEGQLNWLLQCLFFASPSSGMGCAIEGMVAKQALEDTAETPLAQVAKLKNGTSLPEITVGLCSGSGELLRKLPFVAELIILAAFLRIREHLVGLVYCLEPGLG
ncbi:MAG: hypothetical protein DDT30_01646 [Dehalococcoidia bacterium]|nr:hypothetical protein [Bacillota bacterium]